MQDGGHGFVRIGTDADGCVVRLAFLALEDQRVGLLGPFHVVGDGLEGIGAVDVVQEAFDGRPVIHAVRRDVFPVIDALLLTFADALETDFLHMDLAQGQVHRRLVPGDVRNGLAGYGNRDGLEQLFVGQRVLIALVNDVIDTGVVEGEHGVALEFVVDAEVQHLAGRAVGGGGQEGDRLQEEVHRGVELVQLAVDGHVRSDDDVRAHGLGDIDGVVVPHATVQQHLSVLAYSPEIERDSHRGTQGVGDTSGGPVFGSHGIEIRGDAGIRNRKIGEADAVLIAYAHGAEHVPDIEPVQEAVGQAQTHPGDGLVEHVVRLVAGFRRHLVGDMLILDAVGKVFVVVVMGDAEEILLPVFPEFVGDVLVRNVVRHHDGPFDGTYEGIQLVMLIAEGVQAADEAAHAGARNHVYGNSQFFHVFDDAQVREAAGAAAGQHEADRGPVLSDGVHACADLGESDGVSFRVGASKNLRKTARRKKEGKGQNGNQSFHVVRLCLIAQRYEISANVSLPAANR